MRLPSTSLLIVAFLLVTASLACDGLSGGGVKNLQATANAVLTQGAAAGGASQATASAALTQAAAGANPTATTQPGAATPAATSATTGGGGPSDIPFINATNTILLASAEQVGYYTSADLATAVKFYKDQMPKSGWTFNTDKSFENQAGSVLNFTKDNRTATATITADPIKKQTLVAIAIVSH